ncbi:hypothetical protein FV308_02395 [Escherichia coli]|uniref:hypothetical protein n=1 Tax=Escherichia coli TaxID=562 RepID=UPI0011C722DF|nr:hypothetical protein [Escherichia coli]TXQ88664.1 hypothetical protein FV308_02395 [Escherichia coli]
MSASSNNGAAQPSGTPNNATPDKNLWDKISSVLLALLAVAGGAYGSYLSGTKLVESTKIPAIINARAECTNDVTNDERAFRERSAKFLSSAASFNADTVLLFQANNNQLRDPAKKAITLGFEISAYSSDKLSLLALNIANSIKVIAGEELNGGDQYAARKTLSESMADWQPAFNEYMKTFEQKRLKCASDYSDNSPAS